MANFKGKGAFFSSNELQTAKNKLSTSMALLSLAKHAINLNIYHNYYDLSLFIYFSSIFCHWTMEPGSCLLCTCITSSFCSYLSITLFSICQLKLHRYPFQQRFYFIFYLQLDYASHSWTWLCL